MTILPFARRHRLLALPALFLLLPVALTQAPAPSTAAAQPIPSYDVVSIVPNKSEGNSSGWETQDASFSATNVNLRMLLSFAFGLRPDLISGLPGWAGTTSFNLQAKIVDPDLPTLKKLTDQQRNAMLAQVLADRFQLKSHTEIKQLPVYDLVVGPHGAKIKPSAVQDKTKGSWFNNRGEFTGTTIQISAFAEFLAGDLQRAVIDRTNLPGLYDLHLKWSADRLSGQDDGHTDDGPSLFSALQDQLGLKLVPTKGPVTTLVVDHVALPSPN